MVDKKSTSVKKEKKKEKKRKRERHILFGGLLALFLSFFPHVFPVCSPLCFFDQTDTHTPVFPLCFVVFLLVRKPRVGLGSNNLTFFLCFFLGSSKKIIQISQNGIRSLVLGVV